MSCNQGDLVYNKSEDRQELEKTAVELIRKLPDSVLIKIMEAVKDEHKNDCV